MHHLLRKKGTTFLKKTHGLGIGQVNVMDIVSSALGCSFVHISVCSTRCTDETNELLKSKVSWLSRPNQKLNVGILNRFCVYFTLYSG